MQQKCIGTQYMHAYTSHNTNSATCRKSRCVDVISSASIATAYIIYTSTTFIMWWNIHDYNIVLMMVLLVVFSSSLCHEGLWAEKKYFIIRNMASGKVLDVASQCMFRNGCNVQQWDYVSGNTNQHWAIEFLGNGYSKIVSR